MKVEYSHDKKHAYFNGESFTKDEHNGYYLTTRNHIQAGRRLHRVVWEYYNGKIPQGYHVHHIDRDKSNNDISNLKLLSAHDHIALHQDELSEDEKKWYKRNFSEKARPKAIEWHKSKAGAAWHKEHYEKHKEKLYELRSYTCETCGVKFVAVNNGHNRFCSNACKSAHRRKNGKNSETRICGICGKEFLTDKYKKAVTCSPKCSAALKKIKRGNSV